MNPEELLNDVNQFEPIFEFQVNVPGEQPQ